MNFSRKGTEQKQKYIKSKKRKMAAKASFLCFKTFLVCILLFCLVGAFGAYGMVKGIIDNAPDIDSIDVAPNGFITTLYDSSGKEMQTLVGSDANRIYVTGDEIPDVVKNAFIAIEDERFYSHNGIDIHGIFRAAFSGLSSGDFDQGASTITQQLIKNQVFEGGNEVSFGEKVERKIQEQYLAIHLEQKLSKAQILEYYLNTINLGQNTLGVQSASHRYFNKDVQDLTLSEAAVIASITKNPTNYNPIKNPAENKKRRALVLDKMKELDMISETEYEEALADDVYARIQEVNDDLASDKETINSYFVDSVIDQVMEDLQTELGYSSTQAYNMIYRGGLSIYTTQNTKMQKICDSVINNPSYYPANSQYELTWRLTTVDKKGEKHNYNELMLQSYIKKQESSFDLYFTSKDDAKTYIKQYKKRVIPKGETIEAETVSYTIEPQVSFVLMNQSNGKVLAIVGGRGKKTASRTLNRATDSKRQPGSTFKVISTYLPALDSKGMTLATVHDDAPYNYPGTNTPVRNWSGSRYNGLTSMRQAIYNSMNIVTVKTLSEVTPQTAYAYLESLGFTTIVDSRTDENGKVYTDIGLPMGLGGLTDGVYNLELTAAYAAIANNGVYTEPRFYTKIVDHDGNILLKKKANSTQVMKDSTAFLLTDAMQDVVNKGTGRLVHFQNSSMPVAGKTGTTSNDYDIWFEGFTPYYTAGIWAGYDNNRKQSSTSYHKIIWRTIMEQINSGKEVKAFKMPSSITKELICTKSGKLAVSGVCPDTKYEYFASGTVPSEKCDAHVKVKVCKKSGKCASVYCPKEDVVTKVYLIKETDGKDVTADAPYILPEGFMDDVCDKHNASSSDSDKEDSDSPKNKDVLLPSVLDGSEEEKKGKEE